MKRFLALVLAIFGLVTVASAQLANPYTNATSTGTTLNSLATINSSNQAVLATTSNTTVPTYIVVGGAGTTGTSQLAALGQASCTMDTTVASSAGGYFVVASTTTGGDCHPQSTAPNPGIWVVGFLAAGSTTSGSTALVNVNGFSMPSANGHLSVAQLQCSDTSGSGTAQSCTTSPSFTPVKGDAIIYYTSTSNSGALTLNVNSTSAEAVQKWLGTALASGDMPANKPVLLTFDGNNWQVQTIGNAPSGSGGGYIAYGTGSGTAQAQTVTTTPNISSLVTGQTQVCWLPVADNTATAPTLAIDGLTATTITTRTGSGIVAHDLSTTTWACAIYDGTNLELLNPQVKWNLGASGVNAFLQAGAGLAVAAGNGSYVSLGDATDNMLAVDRPGGSTSETVQMCDSGATTECAVGVTSLKATAALTAGETVKIDTANANSVVAGTSSDTGARRHLRIRHQQPRNRSDC